MDTTGAVAKYSVQDSFTNRTGSNGIFDFNFTLDGGFASVTDWVGGFGDELSAVEFSLQILLNGAEAWGTEFSLFSQYGSGNIEQSGESIGINKSPSWGQGGSGIYWREQDITVDMGLIGAGESVSIEYYLKAEATTGESDFHGYGGPAYYNFGDPFDISGTPIFNEDAFVLSDRQPTQDVPAPAAALLLGLGAAGLICNRRRKTKQQ